MNIAQVRHFLALAESLNFTEAANLCGITQPSLTRSIQRLEEDLGSKLIYRDGKDTRLTPLGRDIQMELLQIEQSEKRIRELANTSVHGRKESLVFGVSSTLSPTPIASFINHLLEELPMLDIELVTLAYKAGPEKVLMGALDGCFVADGPQAHSKLEITPLFTERLLLGCAKTHRLASFDSVPAVELADEFYIDRTACEFREAVSERLMNNDVLMQPRIRTEREDMAQQIAVSGDGICMIPEFSAIASDLQLKQVDGLDLSRNVNLLTVAGSVYAPALRKVRLLAENFDWPSSTTK